MGNTRKLRMCVIAVLLVTAQISFAQSSVRYNKNVNQYCSKIGRHPTQCRKYHEIYSCLYGGLLMTQTSGNVTDGSYLGGLDLGYKLSNVWETSCSPIATILNAYLDVKGTTYIEDGSYSLTDEERNLYPTAYSGQIAIAPGVQYKNVSVFIGPYIAYFGYGDVENAFAKFHQKESGIDVGVRVGLSVHLNTVEIGAHYDIGLSNHKKDFKKNDLSLTVGYCF